MFAQNANYPQQGYQQAQAEPQADLMSVDSLLSSNGAKSFFNGDSQVGAKVEGTVESVETMQVMDFQTKQPDYWANGKAKQQIHIVLQTALPPVDEDDDGRRSLWIKGWGVQLKALRDAAKAAGVTAPKKGDYMTAQYIGLGQRGNAPQAPKLYKYTITPGTQASVNDLVSGSNQPAAPFTAPTPATPVAPAPVAQAPASAAAVANVPPTINQPQVNPAVVTQLAVIGKTAEEIAGITGVPVEAVQALMPGDNVVF